MAGTSEFRSKTRTTPEDVQIGVNIRKYRHKRGWTEENLAGELKVSYQQVHKYERGINRVAAGRLWQIACALDIDIDELFEGLVNPYHE